MTTNHHHPTTDEAFDEAFDAKVADLLHHAERHATRTATVMADVVLGAIPAFRHVMMAPKSDETNRDAWLALVNEELQHALTAVKTRLQLRAIYLKNPLDAGPIPTIAPHAGATPDSTTPIDVTDEVLEVLHARHRRVA